MKPKESLLLLCIFAIVAFELLLHWYISTSYFGANSLLKWYIYQDPDNKKGIAGDIDLTIPSMILGFLTGYIGCKWSTGKLSVYVICMAICVTALVPVYVSFIGSEAIWWWPKTIAEQIAVLAFGALKAFITTAGSAYAGRLVGAHYSVPVDGSGRLDGGAGKADGVGEQ